MTATELMAELRLICKDAFFVLVHTDLTSIQVMSWIEASS
jgi:hypothetical protein